MLFPDPEAPNPPPPSDVNGLRCLPTLLTWVLTAWLTQLQDICKAFWMRKAGRGADVVIEAAPVHSEQETVLERAAISGRIDYFNCLPKDLPAINFNSNLFHYKELVAIGTTACSAADCWQANQIANFGLVNLSDIISHRFLLVDVVAAFGDAEDLKSLKIVLEPST